MISARELLISVQELTNYDEVHQDQCEGTADQCNPAGTLSSRVEPGGCAITPA